MPVLSLACHLPHNTPNIPSRYNNEQTTKQTKAINNSYIYIYISCKCDTNRAGHFTLDACASRPVACILLLLDRSKTYVKFLRQLKMKSWNDILESHNQVVNNMVRSYGTRASAPASWVCLHFIRSCSTQFTPSLCWATPPDDRNRKCF